MIKDPDDAEDLTIAVTGATNSSLILSSTGTASDALQIITTAGGIDIDAKPETVTAENLAPVTKEMETEAKTDAPTTTEVKKTDPAKKEQQKEASISETKVEKKLENPTEKK